ncbi:acyl-CoA Delta(11) desaturase-like [Lucilia sericata]|uniref:acyl-CoA Delta(11) desaturase-like n=1 Tax=Lucilia sericata TaxID=13632 RepID=UPI0018A7FB54|nr:acyl-CoA Delta(11) desaturase-like [Lucilia sericata]XP_037809616.1 acyl-CoA Delta(11) desaturase-like [Lucilia sericata]XP_037809617.1 acyl-CoA Delta(11) desaturase-like [Lucilia sericata]XP_037809618.1 acyl-CoA Delta(11) desaturase-like [Lucilia sericata]XP_037809619.1 acyl-CoA Delta(11) desaturase-like [Lucilia sericata]
MPPNAAPASQTITESLLAAGGISEGNPKVLTEATTGVLFEQDAETIDGGLVKDIEKLKKAEKRKLKLVWRNIIAFGYLHLAALYGAYLICTSAKWQTIAFAFGLYLISGLGITAGAHRLWAHRSYKAKWPLRLILMIFNTIAFQDAAYHWSRDHRVHHKYSETDADPHNATRGFFFSHIGWLLCKKHPEVKAKGKGVDMSDLRNDKIIMFQKKYYMILMPLLCFLLPTTIPMYGWNESFINSWFVATMFRWCFVLNVTWLVNSAAHKFGGKPYDKYINPAENSSVAILAFGEGWHNYHHVFPWDYKTAEFGQYSMNLTTAFIDFFAKIGWAYDLKTVSADIIKKRVKRTGDGSHEIWGWGDKDQPKEEIDAAVIINKKDE